VAALHVITRTLKQQTLGFDLQCAGHAHQRWWPGLPVFSGVLLLAALVWRCTRGMGGNAAASDPYTRRKGSRGLSWTD
jgi:hypothetical protein